MSPVKIEYPPGATPLDPNETNGLIPKYITLQSELNALEQKNITDAINWVQRKTHDEILSVSFILELHKKMFGEVWTWAGKQRLSEKSIGVFKEQIMSELGGLLGNVKYWIENNTYSWDEIAVRFHYKLVAIHVFPNGNGRHARLMTDVLLEANGKDRFTWGKRTSASPIEVEGPIRDAYIKALKSCDAGDFDPLLKFVKT